MLNCHRTTLYIDKSRIKHNLSYLSQHHPCSKIIPVLKANAYGHGISEILSITDGLFDYYAVATIDECIDYLDSKTTFMVLHGPLNTQQLSYDHKVEFVISSLSQLAMLKSYNNLSHNRYWLKIDIGLTRLGVSLSQARKILKETPNLWKGLVGHLGAVESYPDISFHQARQLKALARQFNLPLSLENTEGFMSWNTHHLQGDYVRLGLGFYGYSKRPNSFLKPVGTLVSKVIKHFASGHKIMGYEWSHRTYNPVSLVGIGYGDGLSPHMAGLEIDNGKFKVRDPVMMDLCYLENLHDEALDYVTWFGRSQEQLHHIASSLKVKPYVVLSQLAMRVQRVVVDDITLGNDSVCRRIAL